MDRELKKKIFLLNSIPSKKDLSYANEIEIVQTTVIDSDLSIIK